MDTRQEATKMGIVGIKFYGFNRKIILAGEENRVSLQVSNLLKFVVCIQKIIGLVYLLLPCEFECSDFWNISRFIHLFKRKRQIVAVQKLSAPLYNFWLTSLKTRYNFVSFVSMESSNWKRTQSTSHNVSFVISWI